MRRRANDFFSLENLTQLTLFGVGILVAIAVGYPQLYPELTRGGNCASLPNPPGGNQRSLLQHNDDSQDLGLEVIIRESEQITGEYSLSPNSPFTVQVVFRNQDVSPIYLLYNEGRPVSQRIVQNEAAINPATPGLYLIFYPSQVEITADGLASQEIPQVSHQLRNVYVLQAGQNCNVRFEINPSDIPGFSPIENYRLVAIYQNADPGQFPIPELTPTATAIPELTDTQGVWDGGRAYSEAVRITFQQQ